MLARVGVLQPPCRLEWNSVLVSAMVHPMDIESRGLGKASVGGSAGKSGEHASCTVGADALETPLGEGHCGHGYTLQSVSLRAFAPCSLANGGVVSESPVRPLVLRRNLSSVLADAIRWVALTMSTKDATS